MLTLEQLNFTEQEVGDFLNMIYELEDNPEKEMYSRFIDEASLDQKLGLLTLEAEKMMMLEKDPTKVGHLKKAAMSALGQVGGLGVFWTAYRGIRATFDKCSRKCKIMGTNTFIRQKCMAGCNAALADQAIAAAKKVKCAPGDAKCESDKKALIAKKQKEAAEKRNKYQAYKEKHKNIRFTV